MAFQIKEHHRSEICIENTIFEQVNNFNYFRYYLIYKEGMYIENILENSTEH
jgi:hypothetical protein